MFKFLPILLVVLAVGGSLFFLQRRDALKKRMDDLLERSRLQMTTKLPEPTPFIPVKKTTDKEPAFPTPTPTPAADQNKGGLTPTPTPTDKADKTDKKSTAASTTKYKTTTICTPVYGMANSCAEHIVVDTGLESNVFTNLAALSYFGGLLAFVKAKRTRLA